MVILTPKCCHRPIALHKYDLNRFDGNISTFADRVLTISRGSAQSCLKQLKDRVLFKNLSLRDWVSFFRNLTPGQDSF